MSGARRAVAVVGGAAAGAATLALAEGVGRELFRQGADLVCGGLGGVMEAACRGAHQVRAAGQVPAGAAPLTLGVLPGDEAAAANPWVDLPLPTGLGWARNLLVVRFARAVIAVGGGSGTLSEVALAWQLGRRIVALSESGGWAGRLAGEHLDERRPEPVLAAADPAEAVRLALEG